MMVFGSNSETDACHTLSHQLTVGRTKCVHLTFHGWESQGLCM